MSKWLPWILTKTMIPRAVGMAIAGAFVTWGFLGTAPIQREMYDTHGNKVVVEETPQHLVGEAFTLLIIGGLSLFIEQRKTTDTKKTQMVINANTGDHINLEVDGWAGPETQEAVKEVDQDLVTAKKVASNPNRKG